MIALKIVKKGEAEIEAVTTDNKPRRLGPKRASSIRKAFALRKTDDIRKYVVRREVKKGDKTFYKSPKIQRLVTEKRLRRKKLQKKAKVEGYKKGKELKAKYDICTIRHHLHEKGFQNGLADYIKLLEQTTDASRLKSSNKNCSDLVLVPLAIHDRNINLRKLKDSLNKS